MCVSGKNSDSPNGVLGGSGTNAGPCSDENVSPSCGSVCKLLATEMEFLNSVSLSKAG